MSGHTKKHHTNKISMTFTGPVAMREQALEIMRVLGFEKAGQIAPMPMVMDSIPWRESNHFKDIHTGSYLSGARFREGITQSELARRTEIPRRHISEMENGKRPIGKQNARKLAEILNIDPRLLLSL